MIRCRRFNIKRVFRYAYLKIVRANDSPPKIAFGVAIGVFLGIFPTFGVGLVLAYILAVIFRVNKAAAVVGGLIMNPVTTPFFWGVSALIGAYLIGGDTQVILNELKSGKIFKVMGESFIAYLIGSLVISLFFAAIGYFVTLEILKRHKKL